MRVPAPVWQRSHARGFYGMTLPQALGGAGFSVLDHVLVKEAICVVEKRLTAVVVKLPICVVVSSPMSVVTSEPNCVVVSGKRAGEERVAACMVRAAASGPSRSNWHVCMTHT